MCPEEDRLFQIMLLLLLLLHHPEAFCPMVLRTKAWTNLHPLLLPFPWTIHAVHPFPTNAVLRSLMSNVDLPFPTTLHADLRFPMTVHADLRFPMTLHAAHPCPVMLLVDLLFPTIVHVVLRFPTIHHPFHRQADAIRPTIPLTSIHRHRP